MDASPVVESDLGDGVERRFFLGYDELNQIKRECGRGFYSLYVGFADDAEPREVATVLRLALIGGGLDPTEAKELTDYYVRPPRPLKKAYLLAYEVLAACWNGPTIPRTSKGGKLSQEQMDNYFVDLEATLIKNGQSAEWLKGKSFAEIQALLYAGTKEAEAPAPDADMFNAIKAASAKPAVKKKGRK